jgi:hypothetical protein
MHGRNAKSTALRNPERRIPACIRTSLTGPLAWNIGRAPRVMSTEAAKLSSQDENQALPTL